MKQRGHVRMGDYPPGVTGEMIDLLECAEPPRSCENCMFYEERTGGYICGVLEAAVDPEKLDVMSDAEYMKLFGKKPDDYCHDHEFWED